MSLQTIAAYHRLYLKNGRKKELMQQRVNLHFGIVDIGKATSCYSSTNHDDLFCFHGINFIWKLIIN